LYHFLLAFLLDKRILPLKRVYHQEKQMLLQAYPSALGTLNDRELADVGLSRTQQRVECAKPFWQA
jgi:uncharacterized protein YjiS (DUF1127 family)